MRVLILASEGAPVSSIAGPMEIWLLAAHLASRQKLTTPADGIDIQVVTNGRAAPFASQGWVLNQWTTLSPYEQADLVIVGAIGPPSPRKYADLQVLDWIKRQAAGGAQMASFCTGTFLLAASGLLNGRVATTHWGFADLFRSAFPDVRLQIDKMITSDGEFTCAGGATSYQDLSLYLIQQHYGRSLAMQCARWLLLSPDRISQQEFVQNQDKKWHEDETILASQAWMESHYASDLSVTELASRACLSERHFKRRFKLATGESPLHYLQRVRIDHARTLLENTQTSVERVGLACGYSDNAFFRQLFKRFTGLTPLQYRRKFGS
ncbi:MAG: helix-turn-helix domain-containing protein [Hahellaceae bacterium]|nr:helix-turn-helix domain-containing protein [Hahellaceae bacterium]MCP5169230.1 helix-turn-helix domain-containing protein [Hahellaceae bacterium]